MEILALTPTEMKVSENYYNLFYSATMKIIRNRFKTKFNINSEKCDKFYNAAMESYLYSIKKFDGDKYNLSLKRTDSNKNTEEEHRFINFVYSNIVFYILNEIKKYKGKEVSMDSSEEFRGYVEQSVAIVTHKVSENHLFISQCIDRYIKYSEFTAIKGCTLRSRQIKSILELIFSKDNYSYMHESGIHNKTISSGFYSNFFEGVFEQYMEGKDIDRKGFNLKSFKTFKMKVYPILKSFLLYAKKERA